MFKLSFLAAPVVAFSLAACGTMMGSPGPAKMSTACWSAPTG